MPIYFLIHDGPRFHERIRPVLAESWRIRSFEPCKSLAAELLAKAWEFIPDAAEPMLARLVGQGLPFDRDCWRMVVGEVLMFAALDMPLIQTAPETLRCLLEPATYRPERGPREGFTPIEQVHFGARDL